MSPKSACKSWDVLSCTTKELCSLVRHIPAEDANVDVNAQHSVIISSLYCLLWTKRQIVEIVYPQSVYRHSAFDMGRDEG